MALSAEFPIFKCLRSCNNHLAQKRANSDFPSDISGLSVPNTGDNDVMYLTRAESYHRKLRKKHSARN